MVGYSTQGYMKARNAVLLSRRASGGFVARSLGIGFHEAMTYLERMQTEGLISAPNAGGIRTVMRVLRYPRPGPK